MRSDLVRLYLRHWPQCLGLLRQDRLLSNPLLLDVPDGYAAQPTRLLVVGKETGPRRWLGSEDVRESRDPRASIRRLMQHYSEFTSGREHNHGHFWRYVRSLERYLGVDPQGVIWTNLNKCDRAGRRPKQHEAKLVEVFPVLLGELRITKPSVVVFLTGPEYDPLLNSYLGATVERVSPRWPSRVLARVRCEGLLPEASFRTYHPNYLIRFGDGLATRVPRAIRRLMRASASA